MTKSVELYHDDIPAPAMMFLNGGIITEQDALDAVDKIIENLRKTSDLAPVDATLNSLLGMQNISGKSMAKLLWGTQNWWNETGQEELTGDTFEDRFYATHHLKRVVIERYINVWDKYEKELIPLVIRERPMKDQIAIAATLEQGYEIPKKVWKKLEDASNNNEVLGIIRELKGKPPRKSSLQIFEERDGSLVAWNGDSQRHVLGWLNSKEEDADPAVHKGLERIRKGSGLIRR